MARHACALDPARTLDQYSYQTWQTGSGLPQNTVHSIVQSRDGFLWLATEGGLVRFDGYEFTVLDARNTPALESNNIRALIEDNEGALWIATSAGACRRKSDRIEKIPDITGTILGLHRNSAGGLWIVEPNALVEWKSDTARPRRFALPESAPRLTGALASAPNGTVWLGTVTGVKTWRDGQFADYASDLPATAVESLLLDHSSRLWAGTSKGLFLSDSAGSPSFHAVCASEKLAGVHALFEDWERSVWIGTENGSYRLEAGSETCQPVRNLASIPVLSFAPDAEGDLWIGTEPAGATIVRNQKFVTYTARDGLSSDTVRCVFEAKSGAMYIGTNDGLTEFSEGRFRQFTTADGLASNIILSLGQTTNGDLLVGTPDGLNRRQAGKFTLTTSADGLPDDFVRSIYTDSDGSLWIGTRHGLSHEDSGGHFRTYTQADGLGSDLVGAVLRDHSGELWVATLGGVSLLRNGRFENFGTSAGLSSHVITALHEDAAGDLWIGTQEFGLNVRTGNKFLALPRSPGMPQNIYGIVEDANGDFWIPSNNGIARLSRAELKIAAEGRTHELNVVWYNTTDGLRVDECSIGGHPEVWKANDGTLWFSTMKGVAALSPAATHLNRVLPPVVIESVQIDNERMSPAALGRVKPGHSRFAFEYAALSFAAPQKIIYRYRLEGFDRNWVDAGAQRVAYYTNIPPGDYRFRVIARNNDGFWNESGALASFHLEPRFFQTLWFYALCAVALALFSYGIYRWRLAEVESRFRAVLEERNRIGREIHDTLAQSFVAVSMQLEIVSRLLATSADAAREHLDQARVQVREGLLEARRAIWQLRSESAANEDLASRVSKAAQQAIGLQPVKLSFDVRGTYRPLSAQVEDQLLRISQEAVNNALRHAGPQRITIELAYAAQKLRMTIADDGCGFNPDAVTPGPNGHFGLKGMRERAEQIHARLDVESAKGKGTRVQVEASLKG